MVPQERHHYRRQRERLTMGMVSTKTVPAPSKATKAIVAELPGLAIVAGVVTLAMVVHAVVDSVPAVIVAVVCGVVYTNTVGLSDRTRPGFRFAARSVLRFGVVVLGFQLSFQQLRDLGVIGVVIV